MDLMGLTYTFADPDYYEPLERMRDTGPSFGPTHPPAGWRRVRRGLWVTWDLPGGAPPDHGWKIHVSSTLPDAPRVLDTVAGICAAAAVPLKHLASEFMFLLLGHKHGDRAQAGKFCVLYPPDVATAHRLLEELTGALADQEGPYILSDRRYRDSRTVHYRYGAFQPHGRVTPDGGTVPLVRDGAGRWVEDVRTHRFVLPPGVADPFLDPPATPVPAPAAPAPSPTPAGEVRIGAYRVVSSLAQSNAGGTYRAADPSGREVVMKEARAHTGYHWDRSTAQDRLRREHRVLCELHRRAPGLAPEPLAYLREWEHEFLVTELVPGEVLYGFAARANPYLGGSGDAEFEAYFARCLGYLERLSAAVGRLHGLGYRFGDLNPRNILVTEDGDLRLIDFETCTGFDEPPVRLGAPGYMPEDPEAWQGTAADEYGVSAVALVLLAPVHTHLARNPAGLAHLRTHLHRRHPPPAELWRVATRHLTSPGRAGRADERSDPPVPTPEDLAADPVGYLRTLRESVGAELAATARPDDPDRIWPSVPEGYGTNTWSVAYGAAGVVHALHHAGLPVDERVVARLRREALARREELPPGLHVGLAGIGAVLAECGHLDEAVALVGHARTHPLTATTGTWCSGGAGIGTALLALHARTGDDDLLTHAVRLGDELATLPPERLVGEHQPTGLLHGRSGIALFLHQLWRACGDKCFLRFGAELLHAELDRAVPDRGLLLFHDDDLTARLMPYLAIGSAGVALALIRYAGTGGDERLAAALGPVLAAADQPVTGEAGLYQGLAGLAFVHAEYAGRADVRARAGDPTGAGDRAVHLAAGLALYAVPGPDGRTRFLGSGGQRYSCDLATGAAGVLLAVDRILAGPHGQLFTLDNGKEVTR
jgi:tRNA A-37 threonylcarbamoyl transferase component Bud32